MTKAHVFRYLTHSGFVKYDSILILSEDLAHLCIDYAGKKANQTTPLIHFQVPVWMDGKNFQ